jgi:hypothetical protein
MVSIGRSTRVLARRSGAAAHCRRDRWLLQFAVDDPAEARFVEAVLSRSAESSGDTRYAADRSLRR